MARDKKPNPTNTYIGARIRQGRMMRGLSQKELGQSAKKPISAQQVQKYETAFDRISVELLEEFAVGMRLPIMFFLPGNDIEFEPVLTPKEAVLLAHFHTMTSRSQDALITLLKDKMRVN